jgi:hypothetical protein
MAYSKTIEAVRTLLNETFDELYPWFDKSVEIRAYKPKDDGWSIDELLEHVTLTSHFLLLVIRRGAEKSLKRAKTQSLSSEAESDLEVMTPIGHPDAFPWMRPDHMEPTRTKTIQEVLETMQQQHRECLEILENLANGEGALHTVRMSVQNLGKLDMYQWLYFLALHAKRHAAQIRDVYVEWEQLPAS